FGFARDLHLTHDLARAIHNADARILDRNVQSSKIVHAALLLLMLGARTTVTPFHHQPEAQHPKSSAIHKPPADYPIFRGHSGHGRTRGWAHGARSPGPTAERMTSL